MDEAGEEPVRATGRIGLRKWLSLAAALAAALLVAGCAAAAQTVPDEPNIVFVLADDMRADEFERIEGFRRLAAEGVTFENAS